MTAKKPPKPERRIYITDVRREPPDMHKLARAFLALAVQQTGADTKEKTEAAEPPAPRDDEGGEA